jgi:phage I-like protein
LTLSIAVSGDEPPKEFRLFRAGANETVKGTFVFDAASAKSVMAEYEAHGIDVMIDYDHASLDTGWTPDPAQSGKAAGWCALEVRDGELWAVNVRWTPPAAEALQRKEWRYMSPAFTPDGNRIQSLLNVAITNLPATRQLTPLMAANRRAASVVGLGENMNPETMKKALDALESGDTAAQTAVLKEILAAAAAGEEVEETAETEAPAESDVEAEALAEDVAPPKDEGEEDEDKAAVVAATSRLMRLTGKQTVSGMVDEVEVWRTNYLSHEANVKKLAQERAALELNKRKANAITLTKLGAETPATSGLAKGKLCERLALEPLAEQNARVAALLAARGGKLPEEVQPPVDGTTETLSARELAMCAEKKIDPKDYAARKAAKKD